ncbi:MAG: T9SS type A sorting domain-containing protein [Owenweeksia sp.]|nr:T9SS type A sorting domain-containing protein [Owenweeksia sp.]
MKTAFIELKLVTDLLPSAWSIALEDKELNTNTDLRAGNYSFNHLSVNPAERFVLHINKSTVDMPEVPDVSEIFAYTSDESIMINLEQQSEAVEIELYDLGGRLATLENAEGGQIVSLSANDLSKGIYLLRVKSAKHHQILHSQKVVR